MDTGTAGEPSTRRADERLSAVGPLRRLLVTPELGALVGAVAVFTFFAVQSDVFRSARGVANWLDPASTLGIMAVAVALLGIIAALVPAWEMVTPMTPTAWLWVLTLASSVFVLAPTQDLRDIEGDRLNHRRTLPLAMGETPTRIFLCVGFLVLSVTTHLLLMAPAFSQWSVRVCDALLVLLCVTIAARVVLLRTPRADHQTYMYFTAWYCMALASACIVL